MVEAKRNSIIIFFLNFILLSGLYRVWFIYEAATKQKIIPPYVVFHYVISGFAGDFVFGTLVAVGLLLLCSGYKRHIDGHEKIIRLTYRLEMAFFFAAVFVIALIYVVHKQLVTRFVVGFNYPIFLSVLHHAVSPSIGIPYLSLSDWIIILSPLMICIVIVIMPYRHVIRLLTHSSLLILSLYLVTEVTAIFWPPVTLETYMYPLLNANPVVYLASDAWRTLTNSYGTRADLPGIQQRHTVQLVDPLFATQQGEPKIVSILPSLKKPTNVVVFVMESVGLQYIFSPSSRHVIPMPFLESLSRQGLWLNNNYSGGNMSSLGVFSIFSGIYPNPTPRQFELLPKLSIPSMADWVGSRYETLLVTPAMTSLYFPVGLMRSFKKFYGPEVIADKGQTLLYNTYLPEPTGFRFFLSQLSNMHEPFLSVYMSVAAHYPYVNYGANSRISLPLSRPYNRYINNLRLLDQEIAQLHQFLKDKQWLDNTLIIITSDHGEGFGQHPGSWIHSNALYDEQIKTPVLFYYPQIFKPKMVNRLTSSVDILPTMLDALGITYSARCLQGQSLLRDNAQRKYVFVYGHENELAAVDRTSKKWIIDFSKGHCRRYNLSNDPKELESQACAQSAQETGMVAFRNYQSAMLDWYNAAAMC